MSVFIHWVQIKKKIIQFLIKNNYFYKLVIEHNNKIITNTYNLKFIGIMINNTLSWKGHIDELVTRLSQTCYIIRVVKTYVLQYVLKMIYNAYFHLVVN